MATTYNIKIETTSAFVNYNEDEVKVIVENLIKDYRNKKNGLGFECTKVDVKKVN